MNIVTLIEGFVNELLQAEEKFYQNPKDFYSLEISVKASAEAFSASFLGNALTSMNESIYADRWRKGKYTVQRHDDRTLITSVGDVIFQSTYYQRKSDKSYHYLVEEVLGLEPHERFSENAEVLLLTEALKTSYSEASKILPSKQEITKTTVMNKVHGIVKEMPISEKKEQKKCKYLYIEADEDHVAEQHGRWKSVEENTGFISKLAYVYEYKQENPKVKGRRELVNTMYFSGVYPGRDENRNFWKKVQEYIEKTYDPEELETVYLLGDGGGWIKGGINYIERSKLCVDRYHLTKYINRAANQMLDEKELAKSELYRLLYQRKKADFQEYTDRMRSSAENPERIEELQKLVLGNWDAVMRTYHDKVLQGCSAEGHVSHVLSDRLSSRPMGWSQTGADRMSKLRCYERNHGREKIIELVKYTREERRLKKTGTEDAKETRFSGRDITCDHYNQARSYIDRIQATIPYKTVRKTVCIREQIRLL